MFKTTQNCVIFLSFLSLSLILAFDCFPLWEGDAHGGIPLTFLVYVWPSEEYVLQHNASHPRNRYYGSDIHSHPISCALAVLEGTMVQKNYKLLASHSIDRIVQQVDEEIFQKCEGAVDDLSELFIHQLYAIGNKGNGSKPPFRCMSMVFHQRRKSWPRSKKRARNIHITGFWKKTEL